MPAKPILSIIAATIVFAESSLPEKNITLYPPDWCRSALNMAGVSALKAFTKLAPGTNSTTTSLDVFPPRPAN
jgi:hypothetical protein